VNRVRIEFSLYFDAHIKGHRSHGKDYAVVLRSGCLD
jgi:hypothetical protein